MQILVLGMHRSGTSMVARLLNMMGAYFAPEGISLGANQENPKGFWERKDVNELCIRLLRSANCDWYRISSFTIDKIPSEALEEFRKRARQIILGLDAHRPWFLKDPRLCVLAPLWLELLEFPMCVLVNRSPLEVARSLEMRNGFPLLFGLALWERYNTAALNATRGQQRIQVNHAELRADPVGTVRQLQEKLEELGLRGLRAPSEEEIRAFIDPSLYRAKEKQIRVQLSPAQRRLRAAFQHGTVLLSKKAIEFSAKSQEVLSQHDRSVEAQERIAGLEKRNALLMAENADLKNKLAQSQKEQERQKTQVTGAQLQNELLAENIAGWTRQVKELESRVIQEKASTAVLDEKFNKSPQECNNDNTNFSIFSEEGLTD
jgi:hypothetical protein